MGRDGWWCSVSFPWRRSQARRAPRTPGLSAPLRGSWRPGLRCRAAPLSRDGSSCTREAAAGPIVGPAGGPGSSAPPGRRQVRREEGTASWSGWPHAGTSEITRSGELAQVWVGVPWCPVAEGTGCGGSCGQCRPSRAERPLGRRTLLW